MPYFKCVEMQILRKVKFKRKKLILRFYQMQKLKRSGFVFLNIKIQKTQQPEKVRSKRLKLFDFSAVWSLLVAHWRKVCWLHITANSTLNRNCLASFRLLQTFLFFSTFYCCPLKLTYTLFTIYGNELTYNS